MRNTRYFYSLLTLYCKNTYHLGEQTLFGATKKLLFSFCDLNVHAFFYKNEVKAKINIFMQFRKKKFAFVSNLREIDFFKNCATLPVFCASHVNGTTQL